MSELGLKNDIIDDKLMWDLLPLKPIEDLVRILHFGAKKYKPNNWQLVDNGIERFYAALLRHIVAWRLGEKTDKESGLPHLAHAMCNLVFILQLENNEQNS